MLQCPSCKRPVPDGSASCPNCKYAIDPSDTPTRRLAPEQDVHLADKKPGGEASSPVSLGSLRGGRFSPGEMLAERYRIIDLVGRGGMGEVYRAEDVKLNQPVALKFLPEEISNDSEWLKRLLREVSIARQVSHRNVCRVYDIGEYSGQHFISMELVRGEELGSLLKRIGRLPQEKALDTARQLCAGLAAIHEKGILHRDLKPNNVMLDELGDVRITDFGLATGNDGHEGAGEWLSGTPAYMSPEQLAGQDLTSSSDIYSLGLVLYELFTGKRAFEAPSFAELLRLRKSDSSLATPSSLIKNLDPLIERTIQLCLEPDPSDRPASALQVAAMLPGGDPIAAALAMGETPSPDMVAAAPKEGTLRPTVALALLASILLLGSLAVFVASRAKLNYFVPLEKSSEVLAERASQLIRKLGYMQPPVDTAAGWSRTGFLNHIRDRDSSPDRWEQLTRGQPSGMHFWYRESPQHLVPVMHFATTVRSFDPPMLVSGMTRLSMDPSGRLAYFEAVPPQVLSDPPTGKSVPDWNILFTEAGLDQANFTATEPKWVPPSAYDSAKAWEGNHPFRPDIPLRIEAAGFRGAPVYFELIQPWTIASRMQGRSLTSADVAAFSIFATMLLGVIFVGGYLAWRNSRSGLGDRRGAFRIGSVIVIVMAVSWVGRASHVPAIDEFSLFSTAIMEMALLAGLFWLFYMSFEPLVRRWWPQRVISWNRLLAGKFRDPLVGRDVLIGSLLGLIVPIVHFSFPAVSRWLGSPPDVPASFHQDALLGIFSALTGFAYDNFVFNLFFSFGYMFLFVVFYILFRRQWLANAALWLMLALALSARFENHVSLNIAEAVIIASLIVYVLNRFGLLVLITMEAVREIFITFPFTTNPSVWYFDVTVLAIVLLAAVVAYGFVISLGGQKLFQGRLIPE